MANSSGPFDLEQVQRLIEVMDKFGLSEISLRRGDEHWRLRRGSPAVMAVPPLPPAAPFPAVPPPAAAPAAASPAPPPPAAKDKDDGLLVIKAPTVGTFYSAQSPEDPPFVTVGSKVSPQTTVCLIEAMKVFNPIPAEVTGTIEAILVKNGDAVEFGQPLFKVRP
uniref:Biotin carboxyl carrier protein of acetyl-CoA carboxylase n=1 Tax=Schlesneria paludicola TaxID=360056 RepID=A0A7C4QSC9_9PLAN